MSAPLGRRTWLRPRSLPAPTPMDVRCGLPLHDADGRHVDDCTWRPAVRAVGSDRLHFLRRHRLYVHGIDVPQGWGDEDDEVMMPAVQQRG